MPLLRRVCHVDTMPVRGLLRGRLFFGFKIGAASCKKLFAFMKGGGATPKTRFLRELEAGFAAKGRQKAPQQGLKALKS